MSCPSAAHHNATNAAKGHESTTILSTIITFLTNDELEKIENDYSNSYASAMTASN